MHHTVYSHQLEIKRRQVEEAFRRIAMLPLISFAAFSLSGIASIFEACLA